LLTALNDETTPVKKTPMRKTQIQKADLSMIPAKATRKTYQKQKTVRRYHQTQV